MFIARAANSALEEGMTAALEEAMTTKHDSKDSCVNTVSHCERPSNIVLKLLVCWLVGLLVCWFFGLLVCWFVGLLVCWFVGVCVFVCSFVRSFVRSFHTPLYMCASTHG